MAITDHPNFRTLETWINDTINMIHGRQNAHFARHKRFFQGLRTPTGDLDGENEKEVAHGMRPTDQDETWNDFAPGSFKAGVKFPLAISVNVYESGRGWGYIIRFEMVRAGLGPDVYGVDGDRWIYQHNEGPDNRQGIWGEWYIEVME